MPKMTWYLGKVQAKRMKPTLRHRPAIWEAMLGTVYAMNDNREIEYFDYYWDDAIEFANIKDKKDVRLAKQTMRVSYGTNSPSSEPRLKQIVLWVEE